MDTTYNLLTDFDTLYGALVTDYISNPERVINRDGKEWAIKNGMCISRAATYSIPLAIAELMGVGKIIKLHGIELCMGIHHDIEFDSGIFDFPDMIIRYYCICGNTYSDTGYAWVSGHESICARCYSMLSDMNKLRFKLIDMTEYNIGDWVKFMEEFPFGSYYVNCNTQSRYYGNVIVRTMLFSRMLDSVDLVIQHMLSWIRYVPSITSENVRDKKLEMDPKFYRDECNRFLDSPVNIEFLSFDIFVDIYNMPRNPPYRYAVAHIDDVLIYSDQLVDRYTNILINRKGTENHMIPNGRHKRRDLNKMSVNKIRQYARTVIKRNADKRIFKTTLMDHVHDCIYASWLYDKDVHRSLSGYLYFCVKN